MEFNGVNEIKTKNVIFRKGGRLPASLQFNYKGGKTDVVKKFCYLGIVFTYGGSSFETQKKKKKTLAFQMKTKSNFYTEEIFA